MAENTPRRPGKADDSPPGRHPGGLGVRHVEADGGDGGGPCRHGNF